MTLCLQWSDLAWQRYPFHGLPLSILLNPEALSFSVDRFCTIPTPQAILRNTLSSMSHPILATLSVYITNPLLIPVVYGLLLLTFLFIYLLFIFLFFYYLFYYFIIILLFIYLFFLVFIFFLLLDVDKK